MGPPGGGLFAAEPSSRRAVEPSSRRAVEPSSRRAVEPSSQHQPGAAERDKPRRVPGVAAERLADRHGGAAARRLNV